MFSREKTYKIPAGGTDPEGNYGCHQTMSIERNRQSNQLYQVECNRSIEIRLSNAIESQFQTNVFLHVNLAILLSTNQNLMYNFLNLVQWFSS